MCLSALCLYCFTGCSDEKLRPNVLSTLEHKELPAQDSRHDKMLFTEDGKLKAILYANRIRMFDEKRETLLDTLRLEFYNDKQQHTSTLTSRKGRIDQMTNDMFASDSVVAVSDSGTVLKTEELMWRNKDRKIVSEKFVTITSPTEKIQGYGVIADQDLSNYTIYKPTVVTTSDNASSGTAK